MSDLIEKFFREDLTEQEREALRQELITSGVSADRLGERAEEVYRALGLPDPRWTGPDHFRPRSGHFGHWVELGALLAVLLAILGSVFYLSRQPARPALTSPATDNIPGSQVPEPKTQASRPAVAPDGKSPLVPTPVLQRRLALAVTPTQPSTAAPPSFTPADAGSPKPFSSLSVKLHRTKKGPLTVRVLDVQGNEVALLFQGELPPGDRTFEWNGLLKDKNPASPGIYRIEIRSGTWVQTKEVRIQP